MKSPAIKFSNWLLLFTSCLFALFCAEAGLRFFWNKNIEAVKTHAIHSPANGKTIRVLKPHDEYVSQNGVRIQTNSYGFRDEEHPASNPDDKTRIFFVGDSFTASVGVPEKERLSSIIRDRLERHWPQKFEVFNFGIGGSGAQDYLERIKHFAPIFKPRLLVIPYVLNDANFDDEHHAEIVRLPFGKDAKVWLHEHIALYRFLNFSLGQVYQSFVKKGKRDEKHHEIREAGTLASYQNESRNLERLKEIFREIRVLGQELDFKTLMVVWPMFDDETDDGYPYGPVHQVVKSISEQNQFPFMDLFANFYKVPGPTLWVSKYDHHPNATAQKIAADAVYPRLLHVLNVQEEFAEAVK